MNKKWEGLPIIIIGQGGLGKKIEAIIKEINKQSKNKIYNFWGYIDDNDKYIFEEKWLGKIDSLREIIKEKTVGIVLGIGSPNIKKEIYLKIKNIKNIVYPNIIHPQVYIYEDINLGIGNIICPGVNICTNVEIGNFNLFNLSSTIGHDTKIQDFCVINPLSSISGNVLIDDTVLIGTGANILQNIHVENDVTIGAGALITKDCLKNKLYIGLPGRENKK